MSLQQYKDSAIRHVVLFEQLKKGEINDLQRYYRELDKLIRELLSCGELLDLTARQYQSFLKEAEKDLQLILKAMSNGIELKLHDMAHYFDNVTQQASEAVGAITTVKTAKTAADASLTASAASAATTQATTQAAAASATALWTPAATAASVASFGSAAMIGLSALMMVLTSMKAFKTGGHVLGAGTGTSDSIPTRLSNGEFVTRVAVVKQRGMLDFMKDINTRGWAAVADRKIAYHSTGGLAGMPEISAPSLPSINLSPAENTGGSTVKNNISLVTVKDQNEVANLINNHQGTRDAIETYLIENNQTIKQIL